MEEREIQKKFKKAQQNQRKTARLLLIMIGICGIYLIMNKIEINNQFLDNFLFYFSLLLCLFVASILILSFYLDFKNWRCPKCNRYLIIREINLRECPFCKTKFVSQPKKEIASYKKLN
jgi:rubrerythrin